LFWSTFCPTSWVRIWRPTARPKTYPKSLEKHSFGTLLGSGQPWPGSSGRRPKTCPKSLAADAPPKKASPKLRKALIWNTFGLRPAWAQAGHVLRKL